MNRMILGLIILFCFSLNASLAQNSDLIINEIMFYPLEKNGEFIELYNKSNKPINLIDLKVQYEKNKIDGIEPLNNGAFLNPGSYAVIIEGDYDLANGHLKNRIPVDVPILKITDNSFGRTGMSNSSDRIVYLIMGEKIVDSVKYTADNKAGYSDERISINDSNWGNSIYVDGTPGKKNSISPKEIDGSISIYTGSGKIISGEPFPVIYKIKNLGTESLSNIRLNIFMNKEGKSEKTNIFSTSIEQISPLDSISESLTFSIQDTGLYRFNALLEVLNDENPFNNSDSVSINVLEKPLGLGKLFITEIMYNPEDEPEWIELYNSSGKTINLKGFFISDRSKSKRIQNDYSLQDNEYVVIASDSNVSKYYPYDFPFIVTNLPSLNNSGDKISLSDSNNFLLDSLDYTSFIKGNNNRSLEKYLYKGENDSLNWKYTESPLKATPGRINSISPKNNDLAISFVREKRNYFTGTLNNIIMRLTNVGITPRSNVTITLSKSSVTIWDTTLISVFPADTIILRYNEKTLLEGENKFRVELENFQDEYEFNNWDTLTVTGYKRECLWKDIVITEFMSEPLNDNPEWIELYNRSKKVIALNGFMIADNRDTVILKEEKELLPSEFIVIAEDTSNEFKNIKYITSNIPSLNNGKDEIKLLDNFGFLIDSLNYVSEGNYINGGSHEKVIIEAFQDNELWKPYKYGIGGTPGKINSVSIKDYDLELSNFAIKPEFPSPSDSLKISLTVKNIGKYNNQGELLVSSEGKKIYNVNSILLNKGDSLNFFFSYPNRENAAAIKAKIYSINDYDTLNNSVEKELIYSFDYNSVVITEFYPYPDVNDVEWIEVYNNSQSSINLKNWEIVDKSMSKTIITSDELLLNSGEYLVFASDSLIFNKYDTIPSKLIILNLPGLNNTEEKLILRDSLRVIVDSLSYDETWDIKKGISIEKKDYQKPFEKVNMGYSEDKERGTPGRINSICEMEHDILIDSILTFPEFPSQNDEIKVGILVKNRGKTGEQFIYKIIINGKNFETGNSHVNDSILVLSSNNYVFKDTMKIDAIIMTENDENNFNNYLTVKINPGSNKGDIKISELMIDNDDRIEWIELKNITDKEINLLGWSYSDVEPQLNYRKINNEVTISDYLIISNSPMNIDVPVFVDKSLSFSNINDGFVIRDARGAVIDSFYYDEQIKKLKNKSIERIDVNESTNNPFNWHFALENNSCGKDNSVNGFIPLQKGDILINEILYNSDSLKSEFIEIKNVSSHESELAQLKFYINGNEFYPVQKSILLLPDSIFTVTNDSLLEMKYDLNKCNYVVSPENFSIPNSSGIIKITDFNGVTIDSISYNDSFHNPNFINTKNISLERINSGMETNYKGNWTSSVNIYGATPCSENSVLYKREKEAGNIQIAPNPFSPDDDGFEDICFITIQTRKIVESVNCLIFDDKGRLVRRVNEFSFANGILSLAFDGLNDERNRLKIGIYILYLDVNYVDGTKSNYKKLIVLAHKL